MVSNDTSSSQSIYEVTKVSTPTNDNTPSYTFSSNINDTINFGGVCTSETANAYIGINTIELNTLDDGVYSSCTLKVTDRDGDESNLLTISSFTVDTASPSLIEVTAIKSPANDHTPTYIFYSSESGTITYGGRCSTYNVAAYSGNNYKTFSSLSAATYSDCTIQVRDSAGNQSNILQVSSFEIVSGIGSSMGNSVTIDGYHYSGSKTITATITPHQLGF